MQQNSDYIRLAADLTTDSIVDGPGLRASIYLAGCYHKCPGCHNPQSWDMNGGKEMEVDEIVEILKQSGHTKFTITGGDPFYQPTGLLELVVRIRKEIPGSNIWCYTGFLFEDLLDREEMVLILKNIDVLVDGPFIQELRDESLTYRGSSNQRVLEIPKDL